MATWALDLRCRLNKARGQARPHALKLHESEKFGEVRRSRNFVIRSQLNFRHMHHINIYKSYTSDRTWSCMIIFNMYTWQVYDIHLLIVLTHFKSERSVEWEKRNTLRRPRRHCETAPAPASLPNRSHGPGLDIAATHETPHGITYYTKYHIHIMIHMIHIIYHQTEIHDTHTHTSLQKCTCAMHSCITLHGITLPYICKQQICEASPSSNGEVYTRRHSPPMGQTP